MHDDIHALDGGSHRIVIGQIRYKKMIVGNRDMGIALRKALREVARAVEGIHVIAIRLLGQRQIGAAANMARRSGDERFYRCGHRSDFLALFGCVRRCSSELKGF